MFKNLDNQVPKNNPSTLEPQHNEQNISSENMLKSSKIS